MPVDIVADKASVTFTVKLARVEAGGRSESTETNLVETSTFLKVGRNWLYSGVSLNFFFTALSSHRHIFLDYVHT